MADIRQPRTRPSVLKHLDGCFLDEGHRGPCRTKRVGDYDAARDNPITDQPPPRPAKGDVWRLVIADMENRRTTGITRYGTPLQANNGRDALVDAYQEVLDLAVYLRQVIEERQS